MTQTHNISRHPCPGEDWRKHLIWLVLALFVLPFMVTGKSLWIDEAQTAIYAKIPGFGSFVSKIDSDNKTGTLSEGLMPLSMFLAWIGGKVFEVTELSLRLPNLLYLALGMVFLWRAGVALGMNYLVLLFAAHPFVWYYADEARPYSLQIALGCVLLWSYLKIIRTQGGSRSGWFGFFASCLCLCASSLLCVIPVGATGVSLLFLILRRHWALSRFVVVTGVVFMPLFLVLGAFYYHALHSSSGPKLWTFGASNIVYSLYEAIGFQGLGPGRGDLRDAARGNGSLRALFLSYAVPLATLAIAWMLVGIAGFRKMRTKRNPHMVEILSVLMVSLFGFIVLGALMKFPFWGRHLSPLLAFLVIFAACCCDSKRGFGGRIMVCFLAVTWAASSLNLRCNPRFAKDDYRDAAAFAKESASAGEQTWWVADISGAHFYGLRPCKLEKDKDKADWDAEGKEADKTCHWIMNASHKDLDSLPQPKWVIVSKPDIYDNTGEVLRFLANQKYKIVRSFASFEVWTR